jgi:hypothetical protein
VKLAFIRKKLNTVSGNAAVGVYRRISLPHLISMCNGKTSKIYISFQIEGKKRYGKTI